MLEYFNVTPQHTSRRSALVGVEITQEITYVFVRSSRADDVTWIVEMWTWFIEIDSCSIAPLQSLYQPPHAAGLLCGQSTSSLPLKAGRATECDKAFFMPRVDQTHFGLGKYTNGKFPSLGRVMVSKSESPVSMRRPSDR